MTTSGSEGKKRRLVAAYNIREAFLDPIRTQAEKVLNVIFTLRDNIINDLIIAFGLESGGNSRESRRAIPVQNPRNPESPPCTSLIGSSLAFRLMNFLTQVALLCGAGDASRQQFLSRTSFYQRKGHSNHGTCLSFFCTPFITIVSLTVSFHIVAPYRDPRTLRVNSPRRFTFWKQNRPRCNYQAAPSPRYDLVTTEAFNSHRRSL